jgi:hypothetical protein
MADHDVRRALALYDTPRDPRLLELTVSAVQQANGMVKQLEADARYIGSHFDFPTAVSYDDRGIPRFTRENITDYGDRFGLRRTKFHEFAFEDVPGLVQLIDYVLQSEHLTDRFGPGALMAKTDQDFTRIGIGLFALNLLDRARHTFGPDPTEGDLAALYLQREPEFFADKLPVEIVVPLVMTKFEIQGRVSLARDLHIERLADDDQLARVVGSFSHGPVNSFVAEAATHALVWTGYEVPPHFNWFMGKADFYPNEIIDTAVAALRLVVDAAVGYAQILLRPVGWAHSWAGPLPPLIRAATLHRYPRSLDLAPGRYELPTIPNDLLSVVGVAYERLLEAPSEVRLAARRLNSAMLRDREDDALLDACIALEAVLGEHTEVVHKLALRVAALSTLSPVPLELGAPDVFRAMKRIYTYRSKLIHGANDAAKAAVFSPGTGAKAWETLDLALRFVRTVILVLLDHPEFLRSAAIEEALLATALTPKQVEQELATDAASDAGEPSEGNGSEGPV